MLFSFVIPCYNSEKSICGVVEQIRAVMGWRGVEDYQIVLVNDSSPDGTWDVIRSLAESDARIVSIDLAKNAGQHAAILAGCRYCDGDFVVCADDDLQTPIDRIWDLKDKLDEGYDVVCAKYVERGKRSFSRWLGTSLNVFMRRWLIAPDDKAVSAYFMARKFVIDEIVKYENPYPYITGLMSRTTSSIARIEMEQYERQYGSSGYNFKKLISLWLNGFTAFSLKPLRVASVVGFISSAVGILMGIYIIIQKILNPTIAAGWTSITSIVLVIGGIQMLILGLIGEYVGRIYICINSTPQSIIRSVVKAKRSPLTSTSVKEAGNTNEELAAERE